MGVEVVVPLVLLILLFGYFVFYNYTRKKILVLHSYDATYSWVQGVNQGIDSVLKKQELINVQYYYMDTKRHPDEAYKRRAGQNAKQIIKMIDPDVILAVDDDAQQYVAASYMNQPDISVVFTGVNNKAEAYDYVKNGVQATNVTGILERLPLEGIRDALLLLAEKQGIKGPIRIVHISDNSQVVTYDDTYMHEFKGWGRVDLRPSKLVSTYDQWQKAIADAAQEADFIIISNYRKIYQSEGSDNLVSPHEIMKWTMENTKVPIIGVNEFVAEDGASLAIAASPYEQGEVAAKQASRIITEKIPAKNVPIEKTKQFVVCMRPALLGKRNLNLPDVYSAFSRATKKTFD